MKKSRENLKGYFRSISIREGQNFCDWKETPFIIQT